MALFIFEHPYLFFSMFGMTLIAVVAAVGEIADTYERVKTVEANKELAITKVLAEVSVSVAEIENGVYE